LEESSRARHAGVLDRISNAALQAISDEDLQILSDMSFRGGRFEDCTPEQKATVLRFSAACETTAMTLFGRRLSDLDVSARLAESERSVGGWSSRSAVTPIPWRHRPRFST
jgi:hypothetical protein